MPSRLRLLFVIIDLYGGAGVFCRNLAAGLKRHHGDEFELHLLVLRNRALLPQDHGTFDHLHILDSVISEGRRRYIESALHVLRLRRAIRRIKPDMMLTIGSYPNLLAPLAAPRVPAVLTVHSNTTQLLAEARFGKLITRLIRWRYPRNVVVAPSQGVAQDLRENFGASRVQIIHHGVDVERIRELARQPAADLPTREAYIIAVGRLTPAKDYPTLLRAFAAARKQGLREALLIIGDGEEQDAIRQLISSLELADAVHLLGHRENPYPYMQPARLFVMSSIWEGFGLALVEAMALDLPCVATDCPSGPGEILEGGRYGLLVPPANPRALCDAMLKLSSSPPQREFFAAQSRIRAVDFTLERMAKQYHHLLMKVLSNRAS